MCISVFRTETMCKWHRDLLLPVRVRAQDGDSQDKVHHDRDKDHAEAQQYGSVLSCPQSCHCLPLVQDVIFTNLLVDGSEKG